MKNYCNKHLILSRGLFAKAASFKVKLTVRAVVKLQSLFKITIIIIIIIIIIMTIIINNRKIFDTSLAERQSKIFFCCCCFLFFPGPNKRKQTFSSYCKWCDYQITFIVAKFEKKKKEQRKLTKFCNNNINANIYIFCEKRRCYTIE